MTRVGIVGAGFMGTTHAAGWAATDAQLAAIIAGPDTPPRVLADRYGATAYSDLDAFLAAVDVVDVCAPTHLHAELVEAAAAAGKDVVCEKPLARTADQAERMLAACEAAGVRLLVAHVVRFFPEYAAAKAAVERGAVGQPAVLRFSRATYQPSKPADNWFVDHGKSGGLVFDLMVHDIDQARWFAGDVTSVYARSVAAARPGAGLDHAIAVLRHRSGALTHLEASWAYPPPTFRTRGEIAGEAGVISWDSDRDRPVHLLPRDEPGDDGPGVPAISATVAEDPYTTQIRHFLAVLRGETAPLVTAEDGLAAVRIAAAVAASVERGVAIDLDPSGAGPEVSR